MKIIDNVNSLADIMNTFKQLEDPEFINEQWITPEDINTVKEELTKKMEQYKSEVQEYIEYKLTERQEHVILYSGISDHITTLAKRMNIEDNKIKKIDSWIDYLCKFAGITELKTPVAEIKYTGWDKMKVTDNTLLPEDMKKHVFIHTIETDKKEERKDLIGKWYKEEINYPWLPEIKKWFKWVVSGRDKKILELWNQLNAGDISKEEHEEEMKKIKEEQKIYEWKIRIDDSKSLSIK